MSLRRFLAALQARNLEFLRDRTALGWNLIMPVLIVMGFAFAFTTGQEELYKVGLYGEPGQHHNLEEFLSTRYVDFIPVDDLGRMIEKVDRHQLDLLLDLENRRYWVNSTSPKGYLLEQLLLPYKLQRETLSGSEIRYVDWVVPGVLGMNIMFSALFGVGYVIVRYRKNGVLKRLRATPLSAFEFISAQIASRLLMIVAVTVLVYVGTDLVVDFRMVGSYWLLFLILILGALSMISVGLLVAARITSEEAANGLLNLMSWPMMLLSGVWFSLEGSHPLVQKLSLALPLTHMVDAARVVMIEGAGFTEVASQLLILTLFTLCFVSIGSKTFRWE
ncbi:MAG: ABC transporter permease [gamma proteobacterium symbiont of Ctena orbiculata]|uniref:Transport permease protein n=1 Tax=Candidatus Thiodiazotropha taylori TaxID=2792791 RepID=A0A944MFH4_9GAMM|nr:ABC transporter permease [Candidatus Thiodiazotropha taylori]PUB89216.1 MAG: ABC transporter permease [gamma proteobacterium symbiont of Ctena orbiculata]MBT2990447.1 ABC transporter permease [Candidatus Thiodiazotropha taylori]MBT2998452.1 ABC transporter permease [Candidatus Thiodiazotropha taylori]MBT3002648.1 ABC transporter permease [Candidatus Thiodiazotropha taylori]